jgi:hypothetical protein
LAGPPYFTGTIDSSRVQELVDRLCALDLFSRRGFPRSFCTIESPFTTIVVNCGGSSREAESSREWDPPGPRPDAPGYQQFEEQWYMARRSILDCVPPQGVLLPYPDLELHLARRRP